MRDDTRGDEASLAGFQFSTSIDEILQHQFKRPSAARWARNLRFLTYAGKEDDLTYPSNENERNLRFLTYVGKEDDLTYASNENDPTYANKENDTDAQMLEDFGSTEEQRLGQCTRCELRVAPAAGHICAAHVTPGQPDIKTYERRARDCSNPCVHVENASCNECMEIPLFPNRGRATKFRIRRLKPKDTLPSQLGMCTHYMAVSYCWSSAQRSGESNAGSEKYQVLEEDMRTVRPIRAPVDVIDRAVSFAAENGIRMIWIDQECIEQDNEIEKERGIQAMDFVYTNAHISIGLFRATLEPRHLEALLLFFEEKVGSDMPRRGRHPLTHGQRLRIENLAEALSVIAMDKWNTRAWILQEAFVSAGNMIILFPRAKDMAVKGWNLVCQDLSLTEIAINLDFLHKCIDGCAGFFNPKPGSSIPVKLPRWAETLERLSSFLPEAHSTHMFAFWIGGSKNRRTCNAAVAWTFLKHRDNDRVADKLAILANLCDYTLRLDTVELEKSQKPLSVCIFALAIANGDLSLLSPDSYDVPRGLPNAQSTNDGDFTWVPSDFKQLPYIKAKSADPGGPNFGQDSPVTFQVTSKGLLLPGFLWKIDHFVGLPTIKDKYATSWFRLWRSKMKPEEQSLEATEKPYSRYEKSRTHWLAITHILFEVLLLLRKEDQISVADTIWHSVMNAHWRKGNWLESVSDFPEQLNIEKRKGMFRLDESPDGSFAQKWLVDRIMRQGGFWVGRLVRVSKNDEYSDTKFMEHVKNHAKQLKEQFIQQHTEPNTEISRATSTSQADSVAIPPAHQSPSTFASGSSVQDPRSPKTHFDSQNALYFLTQTLNHMNLKSDDTEDSLSSTMAPTASLADYCASFDLMDTKISQATLRQQRAIFDIQGSTSGQVLVLTSFQKRLEMLPRPLTRSMRVSWVVQPVGSLSGGSEEEGVKGFRRPDGEEVLKTSGMVRGMWKYMVQPLNRYRLV